ncbi:GNAT family N-acetyltransferase [Hyphobacterium sp.]|uniref:GNAT family N-acetyltransferase n=1 Tax=Hyphobacterium sp. TaxID=2004662 RepID=UPI003BAB0631
MRVTNISIRDLTDAQRAQWRSWACPDGQPVSPYLLPDFAEAVGAVREDVRIAVITENGEDAGYFAHHKRGQGIRPVGAPMSDYQGIIARPGTSIGATALLSQLGAGFLAFENWWSGSAEPGGTGRERDGSVVVDLSDGPEAYFAARKALHKSQFKNMERRRRNAERDFGPVRLQAGDPDGRLFETLVRWKSTQYAETGKLDVFGIHWAKRLLEHLAALDDPAFRGEVYALWLGDDLAAIEFGLRAGDLYHSWFPAYDERFAKVSPGLLLLHEIFRAAPEQKITRVDLGRGGTHYKTYYASYEVPLDAGRLTAPGLAALGLKSWDMAEAVAGRLPGRLGQLPARMRRRWSQVSAFEPRLGPRLATFAKGFVNLPGPA